MGLDWNSTHPMQMTNSTFMCNKPLIYRFLGVEGGERGVQMKVNSPSGPRKTCLCLTYSIDYWVCKYVALSMSLSARCNMQTWVERLKYFKQVVVGYQLKHTVI